MSDAASRKYGDPTTRFATAMSDAEALMWNVEKDPWLSSTIGTVLLTDAPIDLARFRRKMAAAVADLPRLRERVVPRLGRFAPPQWRPDPEFDLDHHVRHLALPAPGSHRQLLDLAGRLLEDPFDRTRPLWCFTVVEGLEGGGGALIVKLHHTVSDGMGAIKLAEKYMDISADWPEPPEVDLDAIVARAVLDDLGKHGAGHDGDLTAAGEDALAALGLAGGLDPGAVGSATLNTAVHTLKRQAGMFRRLVGEVGLTMADPARLPERGEEAVESVRKVLAQLDGGDEHAHSPLWANRSRRRRIEVLEVPFAALKAASAALGGSVNDLFVAAVAAAAGQYHRQAGQPVEELTATFIVSTRGDHSAGGNAFTPSKAQLPTGAALSPADRVAAVGAILRKGRSEVGDGAGMMSNLAGVANLLPTSLVTRIARQQARGVDFATSNVRAAPFEVYLAGAKVTATYPVGPVAGTAFNVTLMSYAGRLFLGIHLDPIAVADPALLLDCLHDAFDEVLAAGGAVEPVPVSPKPARRARAAKQPAAKKPAAKQPAAKQPTAKKPAAKRPDAKKPAATKPAAARTRAGRSA